MNKKNSQIINGKLIGDSILSDLKVKIINQRAASGFLPHLAIILVGDNDVSKIYIKRKIEAAEFTLMKVTLKHYEVNITTKYLVSEINKLNLDDDISGIIIQLPLPTHIDQCAIISSISVKKDVDGFNPINVGNLYRGFNPILIPCTAAGCLHIIKYCKKDISGANVVVIGRSNIVGRPLAALLLNNDCTVTICHSHTKNLAEITKKAEIIVSAIGSPRFLTEEYFTNPEIVIDVGINRISDSMIVGDVDFDKVKNIASYITPVPGGVGPMTVAYLLENTFKAMLNQKGLLEKEFFDS